MELPETWTASSLGDATSMFNGKASGTGGTWLRCFKTRHVYDGFLRLTDPVFVPDAKAAKVSPATFLQTGDTLTPNMAHGTIGRVSFVRDAGEQWTVDGQVTVLRPADETLLDRRYLFDWVSSPWVRRGLVERQKGGAFGEKRGQTHLYRSDIATIPISLPPLPEQRKIAAILSSADEAIEATQAVIDQVQVVKKGLMQELLTKGLPGRHKKFKQTEIGQIPEEWEVRGAREVVHGMQYGTSAKCHVEPKGVAVLRIPNVVGGRISYDNLKYTSLSQTEVERYRLRDGDVLVVRTNGNPDYVGRSAVVHDSEGPTLYASYLIRLLVDPDLVLPDFLHLALASPSTRERMRGVIRTSAGNYNINTKGIGATLVPVPPLSEQAEIVQNVATFVARADAEERQRHALGQLKSALMSALLTGELRVDREGADQP